MHECHPNPTPKQISCWYINILIKQINLKNNNNIVLDCVFLDNFVSSGDILDIFPFVHIATSEIRKLNYLTF